MTFEEEYDRGNFNNDEEEAKNNIITLKKRTPEERETYFNNLIIEQALFKKKVKDTVIRYTQGNKQIKHELCNNPYGDSCGYCELCRQTQAELQSKIFKELELQ